MPSCAALSKPFNSYPKKKIERMQSKKVENFKTLFGNRPSFVHFPAGFLFLHLFMFCTFAAVLITIEKESKS